MPASLAAVVVAYRSADHLPGLLGDLADQGAGEVVVVDNASPDDSAAVAEAHGARVVRLEANEGFAAGVNAGFAATTAELVLLVNPDVRLGAGTLAELTDAADRNPRSVLGPRVLDGDGRLLPTRRSLPGLWTLLGEEVVVPERAPIGGWPQRRWARWAGYDDEVDAPILSGVCLLVPRAAWEAAGPMDPGYFLYWEEVDWQLRARASGFPTLLVPAAKITHARSTALGLRDPGRAAAMARSTRRFLDAHLPAGRAAVARRLLAAGQLARWVAWSVPGLRGRDDAAARRVQHAAWLRGIREVPG